MEKNESISKKNFFKIVVIGDSSVGKTSLLMRYTEGVGKDTKPTVGADFRKKLPFLKDFEVIVDATYTGILKPDSRAYELVLQALGLPAADCVFVDDQLRNIKGAEALGLPSVHFDVMAPSQSYAEALRLLDLERTDP